MESSEQKYGKEQVRLFFSILRLANKGIPVNKLLEAAEVDDEEMNFDLDFSLKGLVSYFSYFGQSFGAGLTDSMKKKPFDQYFRDYLKRNDDDTISLNNGYWGQAIDSRYLSDEKSIKKYREFF